MDRRQLIIEPFGTSGLLVHLGSGEEVRRAWLALRHDPPEGVEDIVAAATSVLVVGAQDGGGVESAVRSALSAGSSAIPPPGSFVLDVEYGGPDLEELAELNKMETADVVRRHAAATYTVGFMGFSPGFAYLLGGDPALEAPRLAWPRTSVPAGSVALAAGMTAVYPQATPGGWRIIGRTNEVMFDPRRRDPSLLTLGDRVRFRPVASLGPRGGPTGGPTGEPTGERADGSAYMRVLDPGPRCTIQDRGRPGWAHVGVPKGGAADRASADYANALVGNPPEAAVLETTLSGPRLVLGSARHVAVTGARAPVTVDGLPARLDAALPLPAGAELMVGAHASGCRLYVAVAGGIDVERVLGSRSTDTLSGIGPAPVAPGDLLPLGAVAAQRVPPPRPGGSATTAIPAGEIVSVEAGPGPHRAWIGAPGLARLSGEELVVAPSSDRTAVRLDGPLIPLARRDEVPSVGLVPGAVQITPNGRPIVMLRNHPTTGGYPVPAVVDDEGIDRLAQVRPGTRVRIRVRA